MNKPENQAKRKLYLKQLGVTEAEYQTRRKASRIFRNYPSFGQVPKRLLWDPKRSAGAVRLYGIYHTKSDEKNLLNSPKSEVYQDEIARAMNVSARTVRRCQDELRDAGWIDVRQLGFGFPNAIYLNDRPRIKARRRKKKK